MAALLPLSTVEELRCKTLEVHAFKAAHVDVNLVRVRARDVVRMNPAGWAKVVLGRLSVELVESHCVCWGEQAELPRFDDQMQKPFLGANRTVAIDDPF